MAALTWRNVDAPDFGTSLSGIRAFGDMINKAIGGLQQGVTALDENDRQVTNADALLQIASATTPEQAKALAAQLAAGPNARRLDVGTLDALMKRPGMLTEQQAREFALTRDKAIEDRRQTVIGNQDRLAGRLATGLGSYSDLDPKNDIPIDMTGLDLETMLTGRKAIEDTTNFGLDSRAKRDDITIYKPAEKRRAEQQLAYEGARVQLAREAAGRDAAEYNAARQAETVAAALLRGGGTPEQQQARLYSLSRSGQISPRVFSMVAPSVGLKLGQSNSKDAAGILADAGIQSSVNAAEAESQRVQSQNSIPTLLEYGNMVGNRDSTAQVSRAFTAKGGKLEGMSPDTASDAITTIMDLASSDGVQNINPTIAANLVARYSDGKGGWTNKRALLTEIGKFRSGEITRDITYAKNVNDDLTRFKASAAAVDGAQRDLILAQREALLNPEAAANIPMLKGRADALRAQHSNLQKALRRSRNGQ